VNSDWKWVNGWLSKEDEFRLLWVLDFPLFEYDEEGNRWVARHHPFTSPKPAQIETMINNNPVIENAAEYLQHPYANIKANAYDMVLNGNEIGGGSIRIFQKNCRKKCLQPLAWIGKNSNTSLVFYWELLNTAHRHMVVLLLGLTVYAPFLGAVKAYVILLRFQKTTAAGT
jgi:aspartyl-tRNA synthetase